MEPEWNNFSLWVISKVGSWIFWAFYAKTFSKVKFPLFNAHQLARAILGLLLRWSLIIKAPWLQNHDRPEAFMKSSRFNCYFKNDYNGVRKVSTKNLIDYGYWIYANNNILHYLMKITIKVQIFWEGHKIFVKLHL